MHQGQRRAAARAAPIAELTGVGLGANAAISPETECGSFIRYILGKDMHEAPL